MSRKNSLLYVLAHTEPVPHIVLRIVALSRCTPSIMQPWLWRPLEASVVHREGGTQRENQCLTIKKWRLSCGGTMSHSTSLTRIAWDYRVCSFFLLLFICTGMLLKTKTPMNAGVKFTKSFLPKSSEARVLSLLYPSPHLMAIYKILAQHSALYTLQTWGLEKVWDTCRSGVVEPALYCWACELILRSHHQLPSQTFFSKFLRRQFT